MMTECKQCGVLRYHDRRGFAGSADTQPRPISVLVRPRSCANSSRLGDHRTVIECNKGRYDLAWTTPHSFGLQRVAQPSPAAIRNLPSAIKVATFNAQSAAICDRITKDRLTLCGIVETWYDGPDCSNNIACTPPGYGYLQKARPRSSSSESTVRSNLGGLCLFFKSKLKARDICLPVYDNLEVLGCYIHGATVTLLVVLIYRPGSAAVNNAFFDNFEDVLERTSMHASSLLIMGDIVTYHAAVVVGSLLLRAASVTTGSWRPVEEDQPGHRRRLGRVEGSRTL